MPDEDPLLTAVKAVAEKHRTFTTDEVWAELGEGDVPVPEPRAIAGALARARRDDIAQPTIDHRPTARPAAHGRPVRVWKSLVYVDPFLPTGMKDMEVPVTLLFRVPADTDIDIVAERAESLFEHGSIRDAFEEAGIIGYDGYSFGEPR